jgi:methionine-rich copper-binding protein CopC
MLVCLLACLWLQTMTASAHAFSLVTQEAPEAEDEQQEAMAGIHVAVATAYQAATIMRNRGKDLS